MKVSCSKSIRIRSLSHSRGNFILCLRNYFFCFFFLFLVFVHIDFFEFIRSLQNSFFRNQSDSRSFFFFIFVWSFLKFLWNLRNSFYFLFFSNFHTQVTLSWSSKPIRSYSLAAVMNAANGSTIKIRHQTQNRFWVYHENNFLVLLDEKTIVGPDGSNQEKLIIEDITLRNPRQIGAHGNWIYTVLFDILTQNLLVGDLNGHVMQYTMVNQSFTMVKDFGDVGLDSECLPLKWVGSSFLKGVMILSLRLTFASKEFVLDF